MKKIIFLMVLSLTAFSFAGVKKTKSEPRSVWTFSYYEYRMLRPEQKDMFIKNFTTQSKSNLFLNQMSELKSKDTLKEVLSSEKDWERVENKVNKYCQDQAHVSECENIATVRDQVLLEYRASK